MKWGAVLGSEPEPVGLADFDHSYNWAEEQHADENWTVAWRAGENMSRVKSETWRNTVTGTESLYADSRLSYNPDHSICHLVCGASSVCSVVRIQPHCSMHKQSSSTARWAMKCILFTPSPTSRHVDCVSLLTIINNAQSFLGKHVFTIQRGGCLTVADCWEVQREKSQQVQPEVPLGHTV